MRRGRLTVLLIAALVLATIAVFAVRAWSGMPPVDDDAGGGAMAEAEDVGSTAAGAAVDEAPVRVSATRPAASAEPKASRAEDEPAEVRVRVRHHDGSPAPDAVVALLRERLPPDVMVRHRGDFARYGVLAETRTDTYGTAGLSVAALSDSETSAPAVGHLHVRSVRGIAATGPVEVIESSAAPRGMLDFRLPPVRAAVFVMADGASIEHARWEFSSRYTIGLEPPQIRQMRSALAGRLGVNFVQAHVGVPASDALHDVSSQVAIFHPGVGWFRHEVTFGSFETMTPTVVPVPASGVGRPVRVVVRCVGTDGADLAVDGVRLSGQGQVEGFPRVVDVAPSGSERILPAGVYRIGFVDSALAKAASGRELVEALSDQTVEVELRWTTREIVVRVFGADGDPVEGSVSLTVEAAGMSLYRRRYRSVVGGSLRLSVPDGGDSVVTVIAGGERATLDISADSDETSFEIRL